MILKSFSNFLSLFILICFFCLPLQSEEKIDIWKKSNDKDVSSSNTTKSSNISSQEKIEPSQKIQIKKKLRLKTV